MPLHIGVLVSQPASPEADPAAVDARSAEDLTAAIRRLGHRATVIPADDELSLALALRRAGVDGCLLATHGDLGGTGRVQGQLRRCCVPFIGPEGHSAALAYDKVRARERLAQHNLPVAPAIPFGAGLQKPLRELARLGWPALLKPRRGSQGRGIVRLVSAREITDVVEDELAHGAEFLIEREIQGVEVQVVIAGGEVLGAAQIDRNPGEPGLCAAITCPPDLSRAALDGLGHLARHAAAALGLRAGICRVDLLVSDRHNEQILEVEALPPLHQGSVVAIVARAAGISYDRLVAGMVEGLSAAIPASDDAAFDPVHLPAPAFAN